MCIAHPDWSSLRIDHYTEFCETYRDDTKLVKYAMMNICTETADLHYHVEAVDMGGDLITLLFNEKSGAHSSSLSENGEPHEMEELPRMMQAAVMTHLKCSISCTLGPEEQSLVQCIEGYARSAEASLHRLFMGPGCLIYTSEIMAYQTKEYTFPAGKERQLVDCLMTGKTGKQR